MGIVGTVKFERGGTLAVQSLARPILPAKWTLTIYDDKGCARPISST
jgi:hypothetical protein